MNVEERVWSVLSRHTVAPLDESVAITSDLLSEGYLDSLGLVSVITELQNEFGVKFNDEELTPPNFQSANAVSGLVRRAIAQYMPP